MPEAYRLLDVQEVATLTGQAKQSIYQMVSARKIPHVKIGHSVRFDPREIEEWIENLKVSVIPNTKR